MKLSRVIFIMLVFTNLFTIGWLVYEKTKPVLNSHPLLDFARNFIPQKDFIVNLQPLREDLTALVEREGKDSISMYFEFLNTGANVSINPNLPAWPASLTKLPMAMSVMKKVELGEWSLDKKFELFEEDKNKNFGTLWEKSVGTQFNVETLLEEMLIHSDNTAYQIFFRNMSFNDLARVISAVGLEDLFTENGKVSAKEYSRLFRALFTSSFLRRENSEKILFLLAHTDFKNFLSSGIPADVFFSHKFGVDRDKYSYLDSGIVYLKNRPYLITVAIQGSGATGEEEKVKNFMKTVSERIYQYVETYEN